MSAPRAPRQTSDRVLERLLALHPKRIDLVLDRIERLLVALDHPERRLPPVVHVTGTNGKGSVIAYMRAALEARGLAVHVYTSPHLTRFHERIRLAGRLIAEDTLAALLAECETANEGAPITFFEITTAAAFLAFARAPADILLLENGLGGRLDATNVIARPRLSVITTVALDHMEFLGPTLAHIAAEKAGILKPATPCVVGPQPAEAAAVIIARAATVGAPLAVHGRDFSGGARDGGLAYADNRGRLDLPSPALAGGWQIDNALTAITCLRVLDEFALDAGHLAAGLKGAEWPGRLQRLRVGPLIAALPEGAELWLDSGHNPAAGEALAETLSAWRARPIHLVCGMLKTKDAAGFLRPLARVVAAITCVPIPGEAASLAAADLAAAAHAAGVAIIATAPSVVEAIMARERPETVIICGSIYLAGTVLSENG